MPAKLRKVAKRTVVTLEEGRRLGRPLDILVDPEEHRIAYLVLASGEAPEASTIVRADAVQTFASDTLPVESLAALQVAAPDERALRLLVHGIRLRGHPLLSGAGQKLGKITSVVVDEKGAVVQYRARKGILGYLRPSLKIAPSALRTSGGEMAVLEGDPKGPPPEPASPPGPAEPEEPRERTENPAG